MTSHEFSMKSHLGSAFAIRNAATCRVFVRVKPAALISDVDGAACDLIYYIRFLISSMNDDLFGLRQIWQKAKWCGLMRVILELWIKLFALPCPFFLLIYRRLLLIYLNIHLLCNTTTTVEFLPLYTRILYYDIHIYTYCSSSTSMYCKKKKHCLNQLEINLNLIHCTKFNIITLIRFVCICVFININNVFPVPMQRAYLARYELGVVNNLTCVVTYKRTNVQTERYVVLKFTCQ